MYRNLNQLALGTFFFAHSLHAGLQVAKETGQTRGPSNGAVIFCNAGVLAGLRSCWIVTS